MAKFEDEDEGQGKCASFCKFVYNSSTHEVLGRTGGSWGLILIFYLIFYAALSGFWGGMLAIFLKFIVKVDRPLLTGEQSFLKMSPGLGFKPIIDIQKTLIQFDTDNSTSYADLVKNLESFSNTSLTNVPGVEYTNCDPKNNTKGTEDPKIVCAIDLKSFGSCNSTNEYGYKDGQPCIFVKMNRIYGWMPKNETTSLLSCEGQTPADQENLGDVKYYPSYGEKQDQGVFSHIYFPFLYQPGYRAPVVAVQFTKPRRNVIIMVKCTLKLDTAPTDNQVVKLELIVDGKPKNT